MRLGVKLKIFGQYFHSVTSGFSGAAGFYLCAGCSVSCVRNL